MIFNYKMARISGCCRCLWWVSIFIFMADLLYYCVCVCVFAAKVIRQKLVNRQFPPPSPKLIAITYAFQVFFSHCMCVCVFLWHLLRPPGALHPRRAQETQEKEREGDRDPTTLHDIIRSCALYLSIYKIRIQTEPATNSSAHAHSYCISFSTFFFYFVVISSGCDMWLIWHANGICVGAAQRFWQWNFYSGNKTLIKLFSQTLFHGSIAKYSLWEILKTKKRKQITKLLIGRWFCQIPNEMTSWHSLTIYTPSFHLFFVVVVFCPPHLTAGGPKPTTKFHSSQ